MQSELATGAILLFISGLYIHGLHQKWYQLGRDAYLVHHSQIYDKLYSHPMSFVKALIVALCTFVPFFVLYRGCVWMIAKALTARIGNNESTQQQNTIPNSF